VEAGGNAIPPPSVEEVRRIAAIANPVIRNLEITHCYSRLAGAFTAYGGGGANWCTYATWASRQAGRTIRGEDLLEHLELRLGTSSWVLHPIATTWRRLLRSGLFQPGTRIGRLTDELHTPFDAFERASECVARGNLKVFEEIGLEFARYLEECPPAEPPDPRRFEAFAERLRPGDPPDGQRYLRHAFARYEQRRLEPDPKDRAELAALANLEIGFHEQTRLQPDIRAALDAASSTTEDLGRRALVALFPSVARWPSAARRPASALTGVVASSVQREAGRIAREVITDSFMVLSLPGRVLALGTHLTDVYPEELREPTNNDLVQLLARFEPVPPAPDDCAAREWSELPQRMHYIVHLFCAYHLRPELSDEPFTAEQVAAFGRGEVPEGRL
jgi:hypothetical protein